uniref:hypothetical protein n=1 Tax=Campylobacter fetus TaxID=196 RepID=UPI00138E1AC8
MLDIGYYREQENAAKTNCPNWMIYETNNLDVFEKTGFPVRINNFQQTYMMMDSMNDSLFDEYMQEFGGFNEDELNEFLHALKSHIDYQRNAYPQKDHFLPLDTMISAFSIKKKLFNLDPNLKSLLEIGSGAGAFSFFAHNLENYTQIEACESFYILQSAINFYLFKDKFKEEVFEKQNNNYFSSLNETNKDYVEIKNIGGGVSHFPYWKLAKVYSKKEEFDMVMSNANLVEFSTRALNDYLSIINNILKNDGIFFVQCFGGTVLRDTNIAFEALYNHGFSPLFIVHPWHFDINQIKDDIADKIKQKYDKIALYPGGNHSQIFSTYFNNYIICDDKNEIYSKISSIKDNRAVFITSYDKNIIKSGIEQCKKSGLKYHTINELVSMPFTKSNAAFVKNGHPLFKKYYNKENYYNTLTNYDEDSLERISLWKQKKNKKI